MRSERFAFGRKSCTSCRLSLSPGHLTRPLLAGVATLNFLVGIFFIEGIHFLIMLFDPTYSPAFRLKVK